MDLVVEVELLLQEVMVVLQQVEMVETVQQQVFQDHPLLTVVVEVVVFIVLVLQQLEMVEREVVEKQLIVLL